MKVLVPDTTYTLADLKKRQPKMYEYFVNTYKLKYGGTLADFKKEFPSAMVKMKIIKVK